MAELEEGRTQDISSCLFLLCGASLAMLVILVSAVLSPGQSHCLWAQILQDTVLHGSCF